MKKALCVLLSVVMLLSMSVTAFAADTKGAPSQTLPSWLPDDAPAPDPNSEISIVHFYINEDGETIVYDPETEVIPYSTAYGDAGTAAIYWVNRSQIYWGITSYTKGLMTLQEMLPRIVEDLLCLEILSLTEVLLATSWE